MMNRNIRGSQLWLLLLGFTVVACGGCVERRFVITTDPPDAIVEFKRPLSASPADLQFIYNAKYEFIAQKEGYEMTVHREDVKPRWYEYFGIDFISENIIPWTIRDVRQVHITMKKLEFIPPSQMLPSAQELRNEGKAVEVPAPRNPPPQTAPVVPPTPPPSPMTPPSAGALPGPPQ